MFALSGEKNPDTPTRRVIQALDDFERTVYASSSGASGVGIPPSALESPVSILKKVCNQAVPKEVLRVDLVEG